MKKILFFIALMAFTFGLSAQTTLFEDDFEAYTVGTGVAAQSDVWTTWSNAPGSDEDALVSDDYAQSGVNSMLVQEPTPSSANDMVLPLGNKTSGTYELNFSMYFETGFGGHFNIQHFEAPGIEWAFQTYFNGDGTGMLQANGEEIDFVYPEESWFLIELDVNIGDDEAILTVEGTQVHSWPFSVQWDGTPGTNQLGGLDLFAGVHPDLTTLVPKFYVDDLEYIEVDSGLAPPQIGVSVDEIITDGQEPEMFTIENTGEQALTFHAYPVYDIPGYTKSSVSQGNTARLTTKTLVQPVISSQPLSSGAVTYDFSKDGILTHVQSDPSAAIGYSSPVTVQVASRFRPEDVGDYIGMRISHVIIYHMDLPEANSTFMKIWDRGEVTTPGPGDMMTVKPYTAVENGQVPVEVDQDIYITGDDIWVGYQCDDPGAGVYPLGTDGGPLVEGVNWSSTGVGWSVIDNPDFGNWFIIAELVGEGMPNWMTIYPSTGTINGSSSSDVLVDFTTDGMAPGEYGAELVVAANDPNTNYTSIDVTLTILEAINDIEPIGIMTFPNPVKETLNVKANTQIESVTLMNVTGQIVDQAVVNDTKTSISIRQLEKGIYMVQVKTIDGQIATQKIVIE